MPTRFIGSFALIGAIVFGLGTIFAWSAWVALLVAIVTAGLVAIMAFLVRELAKQNRFFTFVPEGCIRTVMAGGDPVRQIMAFKGHHLNDPAKPWYNKQFAAWDVLPNTWDDFPHVHVPEEARTPKRLGQLYDDRFPLLKWVGAYWVGIYPFQQLHQYRFQWVEGRIDTAGKLAVRPRDAMTFDAFAKDFTYWMTIDSVEESEGIPLDGYYAVTVAIENAFLALFRGEDWLERVDALTMRESRNYIGRRTYDELKSESDPKGRDGDDSFSEPIIALNDELPDDVRLPTHGPDGKPLPRGVRGRYGVRLKTAELLKLDPAGETPEERARLRKATTELAVARQEAEAERERKRGERDGLQYVGEGHAASLKVRLAVINEAGLSGQLLAQLDAIVEATKGQGTNTIWAQNPLIRLFPGLGDLSPGLSIEDFRRMIEEVMAKNKKEDA